MSFHHYRGLYHWHPAALDSRWWDTPSATACRRHYAEIFFLPLRFFIICCYVIDAPMMPLMPRFLPFFAAFSLLISSSIYQEYRHIFHGIMPIIIYAADWLFSLMPLIDYHHRHFPPPPPVSFIYWWYYYIHYWLSLFSLIFSSWHYIGLNYYHMPRHDIIFTPLSCFQQPISLFSLLLPLLIFSLLLTPLLIIICHHCHHWEIGIESHFLTPHFTISSHYSLITTTSITHTGCFFPSFDISLSLLLLSLE